MDKGPAKTKLRELREEILRRHVNGRTYRVAEEASPPRDTAPADYRASVDELNQAKQAVFEKLIAQVKDGETGAFLVWGDPMARQQIIQRCDRPSPFDVITDLQPFGVLVDHRIDDVNESLVA